MIWTDDEGLYVEDGGVAIRIMVDGRVFIKRGDTIVGRGSLAGGGYQPGTVRGSGYFSPNDEYVMIRVEVSNNRFLLISTSKGGVFQFPCPWALEGEPVLPAKKFAWFLPVGGASIVSAPVIYGFTDPYAVSPPYKLQEVPTDTGTVGDVLTAYILPNGPCTVSLVMDDGVTTYDRVADSFRVRIDFDAPHFVSGASGAYPRIREDTPDEPIDVSDWVISCSPVGPEDGPQGLMADLALRGDAPVPELTEAELRPVRLTYYPHPDDPDAPNEIVFDMVASAPDWDDGLEPEQTIVRFKLTDRMQLVREAQVSESVPFDGLPLCRPIADGESIVTIALREGGITNEELEDLPEVLNSFGDLYLIDDTPSQRAGEWNFSAEVGDLWSDVLERAFGFAPEIIWGLKPTEFKA
ncbi:MAG: hypothetical protein EOP84_28865, partial [Verrucomicrobiaceae bacterium]